ncbi:hypothetical protein FQN57_002145 [Myotisia sp. PD_48]|nr:hypothetical protein FQN57_002145 [Myotisia sp. PD_48]
MVQYYDSISPDHQEWIRSQAVFFVASAPSFGKHVNISPKGLPSSSLAILGPNEVAYVDANGSGNETISHIRENGRVTIMLCSFGPSPRIYRLFCKGEAIEWNEPAFRPCLARMKLSDNHIEGARAVIRLDVFLAQTSCGYGVPLLALATDPTTKEPKPYLKDRETLGHWASNKIEKNELHNYQREWNSASLDGLPGLRVAMKAEGKHFVSLRIWLCQHRRPLELLAVMLASVFISVLTLRANGMTTF